MIACECGCGRQFTPRRGGNRFASKRCVGRARDRKKKAIAKAARAAREPQGQARGDSIASIAAAPEIATSTLARLARESDLALYAMCTRLRFELRADGIAWADGVPS